MWTIEKDHHASGAVNVFESGGVPVLVRRAGLYPRAICADGRSTATEPHVLVTISWGSCGDDCYFCGVTVEAVGNWRGSRRQALQVFSEIDYATARRNPSPDHWIAVGESKVSEALAALADIADQYAAADQIVARSREYAVPLSRSAYLAACAALGVEAMTDAECLGYGVKYGCFAFPEYAAQYVARMHLAMRRMEQIEQDRKVPDQIQQAAAAHRPAQEGQLWEPCELCGREPVYMPLHRCDRCWPK